MNYTAVLTRYGEIGLKSRQTRRRIERLLVDSIKSALDEAHVSYSEVRPEFGRIFVESEDAFHAAEIVSKVFGVVSVSPVVQVSSSLEEIIETGFSMAKDEFVPFGSFAVRARRVGTHSYTSQDVREGLGDRIYEGLRDRSLTVNLRNPQQTLDVEVREQRAYLFTKTVVGFGGMPTGSQGTVVCTISTGLDSPVAAFKVMKRGCVPVFVYFDNTPYADSACTDLAVAQAEHLARYIHNVEVRMYVVPHARDLDEARRHCPPKMTCVYCKRNMMRLAREIAVVEHADAIATGEIIGEQASQTTANLKAISSVFCDIPILRPCIGDDKVDIERTAQRIGTYEFSKKSVVCCTLPPRYPIINADPHKVIALEREMDLEVLKGELRDARVIVLRSAKGAMQ